MTLWRLAVDVKGQKWQNWQASKANTEISIQNLRKRQLQAQQEIAQANAQESGRYKIYLAQQKQLSLAKTLYVESEARYIQGLLPLLNVITAQQSFQQAQNNELQALRDWLSARLQSHFAIGSGEQQ